MYSVTGRVKEVKQPRGGYIKPSEFDVINLNDGKKIGNIIDYKIDPTNGVIASIIVEPFKGIFSFKGIGKLEIEYKNIVRIGEDVILIDYKVV